ncbi:ankyrin 2,3 unc44 [Nesidiocoris tenuis]|uniref:Ankyrin 2,3 unc44 n=2 Tax=Nesidiocoris tenuis TaxID=355587 RepID=A0ABN7AVL9_9HEMI|nr:ankyrin 2,3 unc44 [Nesidiocoris tenuis]
MPTEQEGVRVAVLGSGVGVVDVEEPHSYGAQDAPMESPTDDPIETTTNSVTLTSHMTPPQPEGQEPGENAAVVPKNCGNVIDYTNSNPPQEVIELLSLGRQFNLPYQRNNLPIAGIIVDIESILQDTDLAEEEKHTIRGEIVSEITHFRKMFARNSAKSPFIKRFHHATKVAKEFFRAHPDVVVLDTDKTKRVALYPRDLYIANVKSLLNDPHTYVKTNKAGSVNPTSTIESKINQHAKRLYDNKLIDLSTKMRLTTYVATPPKFYCVVKDHKNHGFRPICPTFSSPTYQMSKFLITPLKILTSRYNFTVRDSFEFVDKVREVLIPPDYSMVSFDIKSMFTNIPVNRALTIIEENWSTIETGTSLPRDVYMEILKFCVENAYFQFDGNFYRQISGLPMGDCLSPILAEIVVNDLLNCTLRSNPQLEVLFRCVYVDDSFWIVRREHVQPLLQALNNYHERVQFTLEVENNSCLRFLDVMVHREGQNITTNWSRKTIVSDRLLSFRSFAPKGHKLNVVNNMFTRMYRLSSPQFYRSNFHKIRKLLLKNNYPDSLIRSIDRKVGSQLMPDTSPGVSRSSQLDSETHPHMDDTPSSNEHHRPTPLPAQLQGRATNKTFQSMTYVPGLTPKIAGILQSKVPEGTVITSTSKNKIQNILPSVKEPTPPNERSSVVYRLGCKGCEAKYIGATVQKTKKRFSKHRSDVRNGILATALSRHTLSSTGNHEFDFEDFDIIGTEKVRKKLMLLEAALIKQERNRINIQEEFAAIDNCYNNLLLNLNNH